jgi:hypothetical protein
VPHAAPKRCGSELELSELATQAHPSQPHSRLMMPVHVGGRLAEPAKHTPTTQDPFIRPLSRFRLSSTHVA